MKIIIITIILICSSGNKRSVYSKTGKLNKRNKKKEKKEVRAQRVILNSLNKKEKKGKKKSKEESSNRDKFTIHDQFERDRHGPIRANRGITSSPDK